MKIEDLTLDQIDAERGIPFSADTVRAVAYTSRLGWSDATAWRFTAALVLTFNLKRRDRWPEILRKIKHLQIERDLVALEDGKAVGGEF